MEIGIIYEDEAIAVVDKPAGAIVHPAPGHETGALTDELVRRFPQMARVGSAERPGVFAKTQSAYLDLRRQFESHETVEKTYLAVVHGRPKPRSGTIDQPVGRDHLSAVSHWTTLGSHDGISLVEFKIDTGRMHQIRIHAAAIGCPIVGDRTYGSAEKDRRLRNRPARQLLHAVELSFLHPVTHRRVTFAAEPPEDIVYA